jgi:hypothetical protein
MSRHLKNGQAPWEVYVNELYDQSMDSIRMKQDEQMIEWEKQQRINKQLVKGRKLWIDYINTKNNRNKDTP